VLGEQVASKDADPWIDLVQTDLEALGYAFGAVPFPAAGVGAPHIRDRLYWVAYSNQQQRDRSRDAGKRGRRELADFGSSIILGNTGNTGLPECERIAGISCRAPGAEQGKAAFGTSIQPSCMANANSGECDGFAVIRRPECHGQNAGRPESCGIAGPCGDDGPPSPTNGPWRDADWLLCRDGKWRPVEPGTFPLAHGATSRVGRLRAYGNAINAEAAKIFIEVAMEYRP
jgi:DNA (cytosine-5)-methyltransferase 1